MRREYERVASLKNLARTGWMQKGVPAGMAETVAQHTFEVSFLSLILCERLRSMGVGVRTERVVMASLLHDLAEGLTGDIPLWSSIRLGGSKKRLEEQALTELAEPLGLDNVVKEVSEQSGLERLVVELSDVLATALQSKRYLEMGFRGVEEILESCVRRINSLLEDEHLKPLAELVKDLLEGG